MLFQGGAMLDVPGVGDAIKLLTPLGWFVDIFRGGPSASAAWDATINIWGLKAPSLLAAPIAQVAVAATILAGMSRRLKNINDPPLKKPHAYAVLAVLDFVLAGICYSHWRSGVGLVQLTYCFFLVHYVACITLLFAVVPGRIAVSSWVWRHCDRRPSIVDRLVGDRCDVTLAAVTMAALGVVAGYLGLVLPINVQSGAVRQAITPAHFAEIAAAMFVMVASSAVVHQTISVLVQKSGNMLYVFFLFAVNAGPPTVAALIDGFAGPGEDWAELVRGLISLSPLGYFGSNLSTLSGQYIRAVLPIVAYTCLAGAARWALVRWLDREHRVVRQKLTAMGVS